MDLTAGLVLVEAEMQEATDEISRLRGAAGDRPADAVRQRVRRAGIVGSRVLEERSDVPEGREADAEHRRILGGVGDGVHQLRIEAVPETNLRRIGRARENMLRIASGKGPVGGR